MPSPAVRLHEPTLAGPQQDAAPAEVLAEVKATLPKPLAATLEPLLVGAAEAARLCGRSEASWWRDHAAGRVPAPAWKSPGRTLWSVEELRTWIACHCPSRKEWEAIKAAGGGRRPRPA